MPVIIVEPPGTFGTGTHFLKSGSHWTDDPTLIAAVEAADLDWCYIVPSPEVDSERAGGEPGQRAILSTSALQDESGKLTSADVAPAQVAAALTCPTCGKPFRNKAALASHTRARHAPIGDQPGPPSVPQVPVVPAEVPPTEIPVEPEPSTDPAVPQPSGAFTTDDLPT